MDCFNHFIAGIHRVRKFKKQGILLAALIAALPFLAGCLTPVKNEMPLLSGDLSLKATNATDTKVVIFNDSNRVLFGLDGSGRINVKLDGKGVTQLNIGSYTQLIVPKGSYRVDLTHLDTVTFSSHKQVQFTEPESFLEIHSTPTSNEAKLVPSLPAHFTSDYTPVR